jgi:CheY-like chemotaxis protein/HPt (histidine-containing phosphotransfer) domain-containing protein
VAKEFLATMGLKVRIVNNGQEALDALRQQDHDLVLMDVQMPVMDGYTAATEIRRNPKWANLPVIAMTANVMAEDKKTALEAGMNDHVAKPIVMNQLQSVLLKWLQHYTPQQDATITEMAPVVETLEVAALPADVDFLSASAALNLVGGNQKLLTKLLMEFLDNHAQDAEKIKACISNEQRADAERMAHTMKGLAGMLGAKPLQASSLALEKSLHSELLAISDERLLEWEGALEQVVTHLQGWRSAGVVIETAPPLVRSQDEVMEMIDRLEKLLQDFNPEAEELAQELSQSDPNRQKVWSEIGQKSHDFDFERALALLRQHRGAP